MKGIINRFLIKCLIVILIVGPMGLSVSALSVMAEGFSKDEVTLFSNELGQATIHYHEMSDSPKIQWTLSVQTKASEAERYYSLSILQDDQRIMPTNLAKTDETSYQITSIGDITAIEATSETTNMTSTFETAKNTDHPLILQSSLWEVNEDGSETDLLADSEGVEIRLLETTEEEENTQIPEISGPIIEKEKQPQLVVSYRNQLQATMPSLVSGDSYQQYVIAAGYVTEGLGHYPKNNWRLAKQQSVKNYIGNQNTNKVSEPSANYIHFGTNQQHPDFKIRKYASETSTPGLYDVYLNVTGNTDTITTPTDIVFVVDHSSSMTKQRLQSVKSGVELFVKQLEKYNTKDQYRVGLTLYGGNKYWDVGAELKPLKNQQVTYNIPTYVSRNQGTFTQKGLRDGTKMLLNTPNPNSGLTPKKVLVLLTDGMPTYSYKISKLEKMANLHDSGLKAIAYESQGGQPVIWGNGTSALIGKNGWTEYGNNQSYKSEVKDHFLGTLSEADDIKRSNIEIHSIGIQIAGDADFPASQVEKYMGRMATQGANGEFYYKNSQTSVQIADYLERISNRFTNTVANGIITDPLGEMVFLNPDFKPTVKSVGTSKLSKEPTYDYSDKTFTLSNIDLAENQELELHYQVRLDTEHPEFKGDYFYPANGRTTFNPKNSGTTVDFGVPSVKGPGVSLKVKKVWQGDQLFKEQLRPTEVKIAVIQTKTTGEKRQVKELTVNSANNWQQDVKNLPKFDNQGKDFSYSVIEKDVDKNYVVSVSENAIRDFTVTNQLKVRDVLLEKHGNQVTQGLADAKFQLFRQTDSAKDFELFSANVYQTNQKGQVKLTGLPAGDYLLKETQEPLGYQAGKESNLTFSIKNQAGELVLKLSPDSQDIQIQGDKLLVKNYLKAFDLTVLKEGAITRKELAGAVFELHSLSNDQFKKRHLTTNKNGRLVFNDLEPGKYSLLEVKAPDGYRLLTEPLEWELTDAGDVKLMTKNQLSKLTAATKTAEGNNQLSITVTNTKLPLLPTTGSKWLVIIVSLGLSLIGGALVLNYQLLRNKTKKG